MSTRVLIAGPSGCGKSTLARALGAQMGVPVVCLDDYWRRGMVLFTDFDGQKVRTFEHPKLYDGDRMRRDLAGLPGFIADGFCLLQFPLIRDMTASQYYIDLPFEVSRARREARKPARPSDRSFMRIGRQETERWVLPQRELSGVTVLDGMLPPERLVQAIAEQEAVQ